MAERRDSFCVLPWTHVQFNPEGSVKLCCRALGSITEGGYAMSVYAHRFDEIWNSAYMREIRHAMVNGEPVADCALCYQDEARGQGSYRQYSNSKWLPVLKAGASELKSRAVDQGYVCDEFPIYYQFNLGNLCNLKCRMCSSSYSSQIARDPVHDRWSPHVAFHQDGLRRWDGNSLKVEPADAALFRQGFYPSEIHEEMPCRWTNGDGIIELPIDRGIRVKSVELEVLAYRPIATHGVDARIPLTVSINGKPIFSDDLPRGVHRLHLDLADIPTTGVLRVGLHSPVYERESDGRCHGVGVLGFKALRSYHEGKSGTEPLPLDMRFFGRRPWYQQQSLIYGELLNNAHALREIYFTGGEPMISPEALDILDYLIDAGIAGQVTVQINSNCTQMPDRWIAALSRFHKVDFALSLDGVDACYEYIRYPARWKEVSSNILSLKAIPNIAMTAVPIVQAYNMLNLVDLCRFCDQAGIRFALMEHHGHRHLDLAAMPPAARVLSAERLRDYLADDCKPENAGTVKAMIRYLETVQDHSTPEVLRDFMLFTNDLDAGRGQSFRQVHAEMLSLIEAAGFEWTEETLYSTDTLKSNGMSLEYVDSSKATEVEDQGTPAASSQAFESLGDMSQQAVAICLSGEEAYAAGDTEKALACFREAVVLDPQYVRAYNNLGVLLWCAGEQAAALEVMGSAISIAPEDRSSILNYVGMLIASKQRLHEAKSLLVNYLIQQPGDEEATSLFLELDV